VTVLWWHWLVLGLVLVVGELATPGGFYIVFFGLSAVVVGLLSAAASAAPGNALLGLLSPLPVQLLLFSVLSVASLALFRARLLRWMQVTPQAPAVDTLVGEIGTAAERLDPGAVGKVELRGTSWSARNTSDAVLAFGSRCRVVAVQGLMLHVGPEGGR
jgi:membrane protein implicated in regulation of membrane protease activity